jgi:hypothetical protein
MSNIKSYCRAGRAERPDDIGADILRIALCLKRDLYGAIAARAFLQALGMPAAQIAIFCSVKTRPAEETNPWLGLFKILERDLPFEVLSPREGMAGQPDHPIAQPWKALDSLRADGGGAQLLGWRPDLIVSMRFSLIFPRRIIEAVPGGILNVHPGPLPAYRGLYAPFWQALAREPELVSTVHRVDAGIDTGPVVAEHRVPRQERRSLMWHIGALYRGGARLAAQSAAQMMRGEPIVTRPQPQEGRYWSLPSDRELASFPEGGMRLFCPDDYSALLSEALGPIPDRATQAV